MRGYPHCVPPSSPRTCPGGGRSPEFAGPRSPDAVRRALGELPGRGSQARFSSFSAESEEHSGSQSEVPARRVCALRFQKGFIVVWRVFSVL